MGVYSTFDEKKLLKKIRLNTVIILVVVAMIALLIIQSFQSVQLYDRKSSEFNDRINTTMDRIAIRHEKAEDIRRYLSVANQDFGVKYRDILKEEFKTLLSVKETISIRDTMIFEAGKMQDYLIIKGKSFDSISGITAEQRVLARDVRQLRDLYRKKGTGVMQKDPDHLALQLDERVVKQIFKKAKFVNDMMVDVFRNTIYENPSERLDIIFLDSVIETELEFDNLPTDFRFVITDAKNKPIKFKNAPSNYVTKIDTSIAHTTLLFPTNTLDDDLYLHIFFPKQGSVLFRQMGGSLAINFSLMILIIVALVFMFRTILTQKKLYELKNDFISNMTHEFKTPISTISLACEAMSDADMVQVSEETQPYVRMISDENKRLSLLVERILQSATLDKGELKMRQENIDLVEITRNVIDHAIFRIRNSGGTITTELGNSPAMIHADRMHTTNVVTNLIDNAIKYSEKAPDIHVTLEMRDGIYYLTVRDNGIGIKKEHLNKIFDKLYRIPTGNIHNVKGFGLGLSYVKAISELHGWNVNVKSKFGSGSEFTLEIKA